MAGKRAARWVQVSAAQKVDWRAAWKDNQKAACLAFPMVERRAASWETQRADLKADKKVAPTADRRGSQ